MADLPGTHRRLRDRLRPTPLERVVVLVVAFALATATCIANVGAQPQEGAAVECMVGEALTQCRVVSESRLRSANVRLRLAKKTEASLVACAKTLAAQSRPEPGWRIAVKWAAVGLAVGGAFALGVMVR